jgi:hypothetical protein
MVLLRLEVHLGARAVAGWRTVGARHIEVLD